MYCEAIHPCVFNGFFGVMWTHQVKDDLELTIKLRMT